MNTELKLKLTAEAGELLTAFSKVNDLVANCRSRTEEWKNSYQQAMNKLVSDTSGYYEKVRFSDATYYDWKIERIKDEVSQKSISDDQKLKLEKTLINELKAEQEKHISSTTAGHEKISKSNSLLNSNLIAGLSHFANVASAVKNTIGSVISAINATVTSAKNYQVAMKALDSVTAANGESYRTAKRELEAFCADGLIPTTAAVQSLKFLMNTGYSLTESMKIMESMKDLGAFNRTTEDFGQAMIEAAKGISQNNMETMENIGITTRATTAMELAGVSTKNGINLKTDAAQRQAFYNSLVSEGARSHGDAAEYAKTYAGQLSRVNSNLEQAKRNLGEQLIPILLEFTGWVNENRDQLSALAFATGVVVRTIFNSFSWLWALLKGTAAELGTTITEPIFCLSRIVFDTISQIARSLAALRQGELRLALDEITRLPELYKERVTASAGQIAGVYKGVGTELTEATNRLIDTQKNALAALNADPALKKPLKKNKPAPGSNGDAPESSAKQERELATQAAHQLKLAKQEEAGALKLKETKLRINRTALQEVAVDEKKHATDGIALNDKMNQHHKVSAMELADAKIKTAVNENRERLTIAAELTAALSGKSKEAFEVGKALSIANTTISTYESATKAYSAMAGIPVVGPALGVAAAAAAVTAGLLNIGEISKQKFTKVDDFIYSQEHGIVEFRKDDLILGGTKLAGAGIGTGGIGMIELIELQKEQLSLLRKQKTSVSVSVDPMTGRRIVDSYARTIERDQRRRV